MTPLITFFAFTTLAALILNFVTRMDVHRLDDENRQLREGLNEARRDLNARVTNLEFPIVPYPQQREVMSQKINLIEAALAANKQNAEVLASRLDMGRDVVKALLLHLGLTFDGPTMQVKRTPLTVRKMTKAEKKEAN